MKEVYTDSIMSLLALVEDNLNKAVNKFNDWQVRAEMLTNENILLNYTHELSTIETGVLR